AANEVFSTIPTSCQIWLFSISCTWLKYFLLKCGLGTPVKSNIVAPVAINTMVSRWLKSTNIGSFSL
ncbi:MAG: hypothetical protein RLP02_10190, partial [Coleofasciculus sp. C2-GNP5-27]